MKAIDTKTIISISGKDTTMSKHYGKIVSLLATTCIMVNAETIASPDLNVTQPAKESNAEITLEHVDEDVHLALETTQALRAELNELKAAVVMQSKAPEASMGRIAKADTKFEKITLGGYGEVHYQNIGGGGSSKGIDAHRYALLLGYDFTDIVRFKSELEFDHAQIGHEHAGELTIDQMYIEMDHTDNLTSRVGVMLIPVGILNENHEPPTFYGVERNEVEKYIIPTYWNAAGVQAVYKMDHGITLEAMVHEGLKLKKTGGYIRDGRQKSATADANDWAYTVSATYTGLPGLKASIFYNHQSDVSQRNDDINLEEMDLMGASVIYGFGDGFEIRALHVKVELEGKDESVVFFTKGYNEQQGTFLEISKRTGNLGVFINRADVEGEKSSREYNVIQYGFSLWYPGNSNVVLKANWYEKEHDNSDNYGLNKHGIHLGLGYSF